MKTNTELEELDEATLRRLEEAWKSRKLVVNPIKQKGFTGAFDALKTLNMEVER